MKVVLYLRRQDELAVSRYNTRIKNGQTRREIFYPKDASSPYYDYRRLLDHWSAVFGKEALRPRIFEHQRLHAQRVRLSDRRQGHLCDRA